MTYDIADDKCDCGGTIEMRPDFKKQCPTCKWVSMFVYYINLKGEVACRYPLEGVVRKVA